MLKLTSLLAAVAVGFAVCAYGVAYLVASSRAAGDRQILAAGAGATPVSGVDAPSSDVQIAFWSQRVAGDGSAYLDLSLLGDAYARKARQTSDAGYYLRAKAALRRALRANPEYVEARASLSSVLFSLHEFDKALAVARPIVDDPRGLTALATVGDANLALGRYGRARAAYNRLLAFRETPAAYSRLAILADLRGNSGEAITLMRRAATLAHESGDTGDSLAWFAFQIGELSFRTGRIDDAVTHYRSALRLLPDYPLALAGLAKAKAAQRDYTASIGLYRRATDIVPQPDYLAALGDVYLANGQARKARAQYATVGVIARLAKVNRQVYNRQLANFYSDRGVRVREALRLARAELTIRKDVYGYDAAAWAAFKNGLLADAQRYMQRALSFGTRDSRLFYHAGMIATAQGRAADARRLLGDALSLNPRFDPLQARIAQKTLAGLVRVSGDGK